MTLGISAGRRPRPGPGQAVLRPMKGRPRSHTKPSSTPATRPVACRPCPNPDPSLAANVLGGRGFGRHGRSTASHRAGSLRLGFHVERTCATQGLAAALNRRLRLSARVFLLAEREAHPAAAGYAEALGLCRAPGYGKGHSSTQVGTIDCARPRQLDCRVDGHITNLEARGVRAAKIRLANSGECEHQPLIAQLRRSTAPHSTSYCSTKRLVPRRTQSQGKRLCSHHYTRTENS